ncbi:MAG: hypothetical protein V7K40_06675 [Nostoc sp.]|uniref:hypothetical protein n=1 Tax=Nostoc sp. TaxID=1180 RepID=UPI002FF71A05
MKYNLNFSLKLKKDGSYIIYNPEDFVEKPISISVPDVVKLFEHFIETFEEVGIVEQASTRSIQSDKKKEADNVSSKEQPFEQKSATTSASLKGLSGTVYICKSKELDEAVLNQFCTELTEYLQVFCSKLAPENFLSEESSLSFSGLREVFEIRNYLAKYTKSTKSPYQEGYIAVFK